MAEARSQAELLGDARLRAHASIVQWYLAPGYGGAHGQVRSDAEEAATLFEQVGDERGLARAWQLTASLEWELGQAGRQLSALDRALDHARLSGGAYETAEILLSVTAALVRGPTPVPLGIARAERIMVEYPGDRAAEASMCHALAHLKARLGDLDAAREAAARYRDFLLETGQTIGYWRSAEVLFDIEMLAGDTQGANEVADEAYAHLDERGDRWPYLSAFLAQARYALGRLDEAAEFGGFAASSLNSIERALGLGVLARVRATERDATTAEQQIAEAVAIVEGTDFLFDRGTVQLDHGEVMELLGRADDARVARERALATFEDKGDLVSADRARSLLERA
jgi:hypothetical protein